MNQFTKKALIGLAWFGLLMGLTFIFYSHLIDIACTVLWSCRIEYFWKGLALVVITGWYLNKT